MDTWVWIKTPCCRGAPRLLQTFVASPCYKPLSPDLFVEYCSLQGACRGGVCRRTPPSVTSLCREMAAQACYKANVFDSLPHKQMDVHIHVNLLGVQSLNAWRFLGCQRLFQQPRYTTCRSDCARKNLLRNELLPMWLRSQEDANHQANAELDVHETLISRPYKVVTKYVESIQHAEV